MSRSKYGSSSTSSKKKEPGRRCWRDEEEKVLLAALKHLVVQGWKSDNGFRGGYVRELETAMKQHFPNTNIKGDPHINSILTAWKKNYASIVTILKRSGVGFNLNGDHKIDCDDETWEDAMRTDSNAKNIRDRSFPLLDGWTEVFGKDRATGVGAKDVMESVNEVFADHHPSPSVQCQPDENIIDLEETTKDSTHGDSFCQSQHGDSKARPKSKKRKSDDSSIDNLCALLSEIHKNTNLRLQDLATRLGYQHDMGKAKREVYPLVQKIPNLSITDKLCACSKIVAKNENVEMFMSLPETDRAAYVSMLLEHGN